MERPALAYDGNSFYKFLRWTNEKQVLGEEIIKHISATHRVLLDVGAGNGDLTEHYIYKFGRPVLVESSKRFATELADRFPNAEVMNCKIEEVRNFGYMFDFIVASHVMIYVQNPLDVIDFLLMHLKTAGILVIVLLERDCSYLKFIDTFYAQVVGGTRESDEFQWKDVVFHLNKHQVLYSVKDIIAKIKSPSVEAFLSINDFNFNADVSHLDGTTLDKMRRYLRHYLKSNDVEVELHNKLIVVSR